MNVLYTFSLGRVSTCIIKGVFRSLSNVWDEAFLDILMFDMTRFIYMILWYGCIKLSRCGSDKTVQTSTLPITSGGLVIKFSTLQRAVRLLLTISLIRGNFISQLLYQNWSNHHLLLSRRRRRQNKKILDNDIIITVIYLIFRKINTFFI